jgi:hypothetical protein
VPWVEEAGEHPHADLAVADPLRDAEQLQREAELLRVSEVVRLDPLDPLIGDVLELDRGPEREPREDRHLGRGVRAADIVGRVGLGVAKVLGLLQRLIVREPAPRHLGEDVVGRPVDDPEDLLDRDRPEALLDHPDHRDRPGDGRLEAELGAALASRRDQLIAVLREQLLVGGDDVTACA